MGSSAPDSTVLKSCRDRSPTSSVVKLSQVTAINNKYESPQFESGGYNWRMVLYPKGNEEDNGSGFVSMYVELDKSCLSSSTTSPTEVFAHLSFFVFNKKENKYFSVQDVEAKPFNSSRTVWGVSKVLPLDKFNDPEQGYIVDGECEFGPDVLVAPPQEKLAFPKFTWRVRDVSLLKGNDCISKIFPMKEKNWSLKLFPKGNSGGNGDLTMALHLADSEVLQPGEMVSVRAQLRILDPRGSNHKTVRLNSWVMNSNKARGLVQTMPLAELGEAYLDTEDPVNVEMECEVLNSISNHPLFN
ncbi:PREDICTED: uncharacterized protein LOC104736508 [Camelina sativa]|uniref:Uncharacterized protein LOC104736508 n=1 Tax=Camelina sativa TaxID=90675 RepID=A0ABM1QTK7_CAMSA|nr:PREDICTED: uncharacterized protein LOC104736508 [Camelina sativa]